MAGESDCLGCCTTPCEPAHFPTHRGMGGAKAGWEPWEWVPLCRKCHDALDRRNGVSERCQLDTHFVVEMIGMRRAAWLERWS